MVFPCFFYIWLFINIFFMELFYIFLQCLDKLDSAHLVLEKSSSSYFKQAFALFQLDERVYTVWDLHKYSRLIWRLRTLQTGSVQSRLTKSSVELKIRQLNCFDGSVAVTLVMSVKMCVFIPSLTNTWRLNNWLYCMLLSALWQAGVNVSFLN